MNKSMTVIDRIRQKIDQGYATSRDIFELYRIKINRYNPQINAYTSINEDCSFTNEYNNKPVSKLYGVPIALKDNICTKILPTTCASSMLRDYKSPFNATVVTSLERCGATILGKTNLDEFAMGSTTTHSIFGATRNPWSLRCLAGGSSGGSAAAVAARIAPVALGSDTGGSVRQPAHFCGILGMKPSYGTVSRFGLIAYGSSLDQIGVFSNFAYDAAIVLDAISGLDPLDPSTRKLPNNFFSHAINNPLRGIRMGFDPKTLYDMSSPLQTLVENHIVKLKSEGIQIINISLPNLQDAVRTYYVLALGEAATNLSRFDGIRFGYKYEYSKNIEELYLKTRTYGFGEEVKKRILLGNYMLSSEQYSSFYLKAQKIRRQIYNSFLSIYEKVDCILLPTVNYTAESLSNDLEGDLLEDKYTVLANLTGDPAVSFPIGHMSSLPFGLQLTTKRFNDPLLLNIVHILEQYGDCHLKVPKIIVDEYI